MIETNQILCAYYIGSGFIFSTYVTMETVIYGNDR